MDLLEELKSRLRITWDSEDVDLTKIINNGKSYLEDLTGTAFNFDENLTAREILLERCRYVYNNAADQFEGNFEHELKRLIMNVALKKASEEVEEQPDSGNV